MGARHPLRAVRRFRAIPRFCSARATGECAARPEVMPSGPSQASVRADLVHPGTSAEGFPDHQRFQRLLTHASRFWLEEKSGL